MNSRARWRILSVVVDPATASRALAAGTMLDDKYRIERLIAVGGMGAVYLGTHVGLRKRIAIKVLNPQLSTPAMLERFHREAITASQIGHEGIAQVTDLGTSQDGAPFLVMEYLEGESLASRLRASGPLPIELACELACAILSPLAAAHAAGIVHRDLKPDNVFLVRQSRGELVKLLDFGISRATGLEAEFRLTTTGLVLGTPFYMSPEQARGDANISPAADLYALGVILYEMLVGRVPIVADNYNQLMYRVMVGEFDPPRQQRPDIPAELEQLIVHAMALEPANRPRSAPDLEHALLAFCRPTYREHMIERSSASALSLPRSSAPALPGPTGHEHTLLVTPSAPASSARPASAASPPTPTGREHTVPGRASVASPTPVPPPAATAAAAARRSRAPALALGVLVAFATALAVVLVMREDAAAPATSAPATSPRAAGPSSATAAGSAVAPPAATVAPPAATAPPAAPAPASVPATITLRFAIEPATATITLDDTRVEASELVVPRDDARHTLRITAPGHLPYDEQLVFDESQRVVVQLARVARPDRSRPPRPRDAPPTRPTRPERIDSESPYR